MFRCLPESLRVWQGVEFDLTAHFEGQVFAQADKANVDGGVVILVGVELEGDPPWLAHQCDLSQDFKVDLVLCQLHGLEHEGHLEGVLVQAHGRQSCRCLHRHLPSVKANDALPQYEKR